MNVDLSRRQSEIIQAAIKLIGNGGIQALTIKNLSSEIGLTESAIYRHFKSRMEILTTLLLFMKEIVISNYTHVSETKLGAMEKIGQMIGLQLKSFSENPHYAVVILSDGLYKNEKELLNIISSVMDNVKASFISIIEEGKKSGEIRNDISSDHIAFVIMGSVRLTVNQWSISGFSFNLQERGTQLCKALQTLIKNNDNII